jgi:hypothetical protein
MRQAPRGRCPYKPHKTPSRAFCSIEAPGALRGVEKIKISYNESQHHKGIQKMPILEIESRIFSCHKIRVRRCLKVVVRVEKTKGRKLKFTPLSQTGFLWPRTDILCSLTTKGKREKKGKRYTRLFHRPLTTVRTSDWLRQLRAFVTG